MLSAFQMVVHGDVASLFQSSFLDEKPSCCVVHDLCHKSFVRELFESSGAAVTMIGFSNPEEVTLQQTKRQKLIAMLKETMGIKDIPVDAPFAANAAMPESKCAVVISDRLQDHFGVPVASTALYDYPNLQIL
jgi:hypothetical protein